MKKIVSLGIALALMLSGVSSFFAPVTQTAQAAEYTYTKEQQDALNHINQICGKFGECVSNDIIRFLNTKFYQGIGIFLPVKSNVYIMMAKANPKS